MKTASVTNETKLDAWGVENKDPEKRYCICRWNVPEEMNRAIQKGYVPATGPEQFVVRAFDGKDDAKPGQQKKRGDRIIMCCPRDAYEARQRAKTSNYKSPKQEAMEEARKMSRQGMNITARAEQEVGIKI